MPQMPFAYSQVPASPANDVPLAFSLAVFGERPHILAQLREDAASAGFYVTAAQSLAVLVDRVAQPLAEAVVVDCPVADGLSLAALARLDQRAAQAGAQLVVATTMEALDDVFGCLDQSGAQLLVDPVRTDFVLALGRLRALTPGSRVRELAEEDRLALLRLTEQVGEIAARLGQIRGGGLGVESPALAFAGAPGAEAELVRRARPELPDPRMVRRVLRQRQMRGRFFAPELFADPAWDMLLDLTAARAEKRKVSVTSLCIASCVPPTTALRWISQMTEAGLFRRVEDLSERRRAFIELSDPAADAMAAYFDAIEEGPARPI